MMDNGKIKTSIIVLSHGSKVASGNDGLFKIVEMLKILNKWESVEAGFLQLAEPDLKQVIEKVVKEGAKRVVVIPLLLFSGSHVVKDIPFEIDKQRKVYPEVEFLFAKNLGADERIAQIAADRINDALRGSSFQGRDSTLVSENSYMDNPEEIANESFRTIDKLLEIIGIGVMPSVNLPIIKRIIHTTGDPEYGKNFIITEGAVEAGIDAIKSGKTIVTDVNMVKTGINKRLVSSFGGDVICKIADEDVALAAAKSGLTRAITAIESSIDEINGGIVAIGNAPSALFHLVNLVLECKVKPALIVGVPVGFVGAAESKEALRGLDIPYITNVGRKGGSPIAVTIVNAILNSAKDF